jgi:fructoselysine-6-P-deglycase FrlB-like protein
MFAMVIHVENIHRALEALGEEEKKLIQEYTQEKKYYYLGYIPVVYQVYINI